ncbi:unnamed protein product [Linum trigynum]
MPSSLSPLLFSLLAVITVAVKAEPDLGYISSLCGRRHDPHPPRLKRRAIQVTVSAITNTVPSVVGFCDDSVRQKPAMHVFASCPFHVTQEDCTKCLEYAQDQLINYLCEGLYGAQLVLSGCILRYETYKFC